MLNGLGVTNASHEVFINMNVPQAVHWDCNVMNMIQFMAMKIHTRGVGGDDDTRSSHTKHSVVVAQEHHC